MLVLGVGVVTGLVRPAPSIAENREIIVRAHADASVFGRFPRRNFGTKPRLIVGANPRRFACLSDVRRPGDAIS